MQFYENMENNQMINIINKETEYVNRGYKGYHRAYFISLRNLNRHIKTLKPHYYNYLKNLLEKNYTNSWYEYYKFI